jgi:hypothetical protein
MKRTGLGSERLVLRFVYEKVGGFFEWIAVERLTQRSNDG